MEDRIEDIPVEQKLRILAGDVYAAAALYSWCLSKDRQLYYTTCPHEKEFFNFFGISGCMDYLYEKKEGWSEPVLLNDPLGLMWVGESFLEKDGKGIHFQVLLGPVFLSRTSLQKINKTLSEMESSVYAARQMSRLIETVPVVTMPMLLQYAKMLHYTLTGRFLSSSQIHMQNGENVDESLGLLQGQAPQVSPERAGSVEKMIMQGIREGSTKFLSSLEKETQSAYTLLTSTGDSLRDSKNTVLVFNALCSRAAMEGGLPRSSASAIEQRYANEIERCTTVTELTKLTNTLVNEYATKVHAAQVRPEISPQIRQAMEIIRTSVTSPDLSVEYLASRVGYATYYFTKKFTQETGMKVMDFIKQQKVEYAKIMLLTTRKSTQQISEELNFATRTYFSKVFHSVTGLSPIQFRERAEHTGKKEDNETEGEL